MLAIFHAVLFSSISPCPYYCMIFYWYLKNLSYNMNCTLLKKYKGWYWSFLLFNRYLYLLRLTFYIWKCIIYWNMMIWQRLNVNALEIIIIRLYNDRTRTVLHLIVQGQFAYKTFKRNNLSVGSDPWIYLTTDKNTFFRMCC